MISTRDRLITGFMALPGMTREQAELAADNSKSVNGGMSSTTGTADREFYASLLEPLSERRR